MCHVLVMPWWGHMMVFSQDCLEVCHMLSDVTGGCCHGDVTGRISLDDTPCWGHNACLFFLQGYTALHLAAIHSHQHMVLALINTYSVSYSTPYTRTLVLYMFEGTLNMYFFFITWQLWWGKCNHLEWVLTHIVSWVVPTGWKHVIHIWRIGLWHIERTHTDFRVSVSGSVLDACLLPLSSELTRLLQPSLIRQEWQSEVPCRLLFTGWGITVTLANMLLMNFRSEWTTLTKQVFCGNLLQIVQYSLRKKIGLLHANFVLVPGAPQQQQQGRGLGTVPQQRWNSSLHAFAEASVGG